MNNKFAFTLAEVLITLGIIGVVSAITMPTLINKYQEHVTVNKVKKWYSMMSQAILLSINDNGYLNEWNIPDGATKESAEKMAEYIVPYIKTVKDFGTKIGSMNYPEEGFSRLEGGSKPANYDTDERYYKLILLDGTYMWFRTSTGEYCNNGEIKDCGAIFFDINGPKQPNTWGLDVFGVSLISTGVKVASETNCNYEKSSAVSCLVYILKHGNMNYPKTAPQEGE